MPDKVNESTADTVKLDGFQLAGFGPQPSFQTMQVNMELEHIIEYARMVYRIVTDDRETALANLLSEDEFVRGFKLLLVDRINWLNNQIGFYVRSPKLGATVSGTRLPQPLFALMASIGPVRSPALGITFIPNLSDVERTLTADDQAFWRAIAPKWAMFMAELGRYFYVSESLPSNKTGTWAAVMLHKQLDGNGVLVSSPTTEASPHDAALAAIVGISRTQLAMTYGVSYGTVLDPIGLATQSILNTKKDVPRGYGT